MTFENMRKRLARPVRQVMNARHTPLWAVSILRRIAHRIYPHVLVCHHCGAEFTATNWWSVEHADRAYAHYVTVHEAKEATR